MFSKLRSPILCRCETWLGTILKLLEPAYRILIKVWLGVRPNRAIDLCLLELDTPSLVTRVKAAQKQFVPRLLCQRECIDDIIMQTWNNCVEVQTKGAKYIIHLMNTVDVIQEDVYNAPGNLC